MAKKNKPDKSKDIDYVLSSIDSLLDTAIDVPMDDLLVVDIESGDESKILQDHQNKAGMAIKPRAASIQKRKTVHKKAIKKNTPTKKKQARKKQPVVNNKADLAKKSTKNRTKSSKEAPTLIEKHVEPETNPKQEKTKATEAASKTEPSIKADKIETAKEQHQAEPKSRSSRTGSDSLLTKQELPVLDEIITEDEMAVIAAGKRPSSRVITEKFVLKTTTDKIIDLLAVHLADYNITRLEYEYLHELIDELLEEEKNKSK